MGLLQERIADRGTDDTTPTPPGCGGFPEQELGDFPQSREGIPSGKLRASPYRRVLGLANRLGRLGTLVSNMGLGRFTREDDSTSATRPLRVLFSHA